MESKKHSTELKRLSFLIGKWKTSGEVKASADTPAMKITGTDSYEWALEENFILHRAEVMMGDEIMEVIEFIGEYDPEHDSFEMRSFDSQGNFTSMLGTIDAHGAFHINGHNMRAVLTVNQDGSEMSANWEESDIGQDWIPWMKMKFTK